MYARSILRIAKRSRIVSGMKKHAVAKVKDLCLSSVLPRRTHDPELAESVGAMGVQTHLIARPNPSDPSKYELIDGAGRIENLHPTTEVWLDVRDNVTDADVCQISASTFKRSQRSAYENALFYAAYVDVVKRESGEKGAFSKVSTDAIISESELSQYLAVKELFDKLAQLSPNAEFQKLKCMGLNKLYELSKFRDDARLLDAVQQVEDNADYLTAEGIAEIVNNALLADMQEIQKEIVDTAATMASPSASRDSAVFESRFKDLSAKATKMISELNTILPRVEIEKLSQAEPGSPVTLNVLETICINVRRLLYYLKRIEKAQNAKKQEP